MPNFKGSIKGFITGDSLEIRRTITNVPEGEALVKCWFTVKLSEADLDVDAIIQKEVSPILDTSQGVIEDDGSSGTAIVRFFLLADDTSELGNPVRSPGSFPYDIQVKTTTGLIFTPEKGKIKAVSQVTQEEV